MQIEQRLLSELIPYINNSRKHSDDQVTQIAASIKEFGWTNPILVDVDNGIIAGHGRIMAAKKLGMTEVPVIELAHLSKEQRKALIIADNKLALNSDWDTNLLALELQDLKDLDFNLDLTGFSSEELDGLLNVLEETERLTDENEVPEIPVEPITKPGDIYQLGNHRLMCADSTDIEAVEMLLEGDEIDFLFTSPPYNAGDSEKLSGNTHTTDNKYGMYQDNKSKHDYYDLLCGFTNAWLHFTKCMVINIQQLAGNKVAVLEDLNQYKNNFIDMAIWNKGHAAPAMAEKVMNSCFEYMIFLSPQENPSRAIPSAQFRGTIKNVYDGAPNRNNEFSKVHAATFPIDLPEWAITSFTTNGAIVGDCFGGTGTTMIACEKLGRRARLMELDPKYCDVIVKRWEDFTGKKAELIQNDL